MADLRNIRNTGIVVGGDVTRSTLSVGHTGSADGPDEAEVLGQLDTLFTELFAALGQLPAQQAGDAARDTVLLKAEVTAAQRDPGRIHAVLLSLGRSVATAAPLVGVVKDIADLVATLVR